MKFIKKIVPLVFIVLTSCTITQRRYMPGFYVEKSSKKVKIPQNFTANTNRTTLIVDTIPIRHGLPVLVNQTGLNKPVEPVFSVKTAHTTNEENKVEKYRVGISTNKVIVSLQPVKVADDDPKTLKKGRSKYAANRCFLFGFLALLFAAATILLLVLAGGGANILTVYFILTSLAGIVFALFSIKNSQYVENAGESYTRASIGLIMAIVGGVVTGILLILSLISLLQAK